MWHPAASSRAGSQWCARRLRHVVTSFLSRANYVVADIISSITIMIMVFICITRGGRRQCIKFWMLLTVLVVVPVQVYVSRSQSGRYYTAAPNLHLPVPSLLALLAATQVEHSNLSCISINCTKGRHRSVAAAEILKKTYYPNATVKHLTIY